MLEKGIEGGRGRKVKYGWCDRNRRGKGKCEKKKEEREREIKKWRKEEKIKKVSEKNSVISDRGQEIKGKYGESMRKGERESVSDRKRNVGKVQERTTERETNQSRVEEKEREGKCNGWYKGIEVGI